MSLELGDEVGITEALEHFAEEQPERGRGILSARPPGGGEQFGRSLALNWYKTQNLRVTLEWTRAEGDPTSGGGTAEVDIFQLRLGLDI